MLLAMDMLSSEGGKMKQAQVLTEKDCKRVMAQVARSAFPERNRCAMQLSWLAGMRVGEIAALCVRDVRDAEGRIRSRIQLAAAQTKGDSARTVLLNAQAQAELSIYLQTLKQAEPSDPLFRSRVGKRFSANSLCQVFLRIYDAAGLDRATSHSGRRTFITNLAHKGVNVRVLAALAGHRSIATTQRYIELNENVLRAAVELV
jgi:integrase/recombinase XerD